MSVENTAVVDAIGVEQDTGKVILTIADHLDWSNEREHMLALQEKLNTYLRFVESGEINETYPDALGRVRVIDVVSKHQPTDDALEFFRKAAAVLHDVGVEFRTRIVSE